MRFYEPNVGSGMPSLTNQTAWSNLPVVCKGYLQFLKSELSTDSDLKSPLKIAFKNLSCPHCGRDSTGATPVFFFLVFWLN